MENNAKLAKRSCAGEGVGLNHERVELVGPAQLRVIAAFAACQLVCTTRPEVGARALISPTDSAPHRILKMTENGADARKQSIILRRVLAFNLAERMLILMNRI
jgi:hypothetical protein